MGIHDSSDSSSSRFNAAVSLLVSIEGFATRSAGTLITALHPNQPIGTTNPPNRIS
jgi:hypothetical protein